MTQIRHIGRTTDDAQTKHKTNDKFNSHLDAADNFIASVIAEDYLAHIGEEAFIQA